MKVPVSFRTRYAMADKRILVDSGATDNFIHPKFVKRLRVGTQELERSMKIWNIDGTTNRAGRLTHYVDLLVKTKGQEKKMRFLVTDLGVEDVILGYPWLATFEPQFSWKDAVVDTNVLPVIIRSPDWHTLVLRPSIRRAKVDQESSIANTRIGRTVTDEAKQRIVDILTEEITINSISTDLARQAEQYTTTVEVPENTDNTQESSAKSSPTISTETPMGSRNRTQTGNTGCNRLQDLSINTNGRSSVGDLLG